MFAFTVGHGLLLEIRAAAVTMVVGCCKGHPQLCITIRHNS